MSDRLKTFDTNIVSYYQRGSENIVVRFDSVPLPSRSIGIVTVQEQLDGWSDAIRNAKTDFSLAYAYQRLAETVQFYADKRILPYNEAAIAEYRKLSALKLNVAKADLRIAAIAIAHDAVVVTQNARDFARIPGLIVESWDDVN